MMMHSHVRCLAPRGRRRARPGRCSSAACASKSDKAAAGHRPARQVPLRRGHRGAQQEEVADGARVLPAARGQLPAEPVPARTPSSASATRTWARTPRRSLILAVNEFREFLTFYPTARRNDYAQFKLGVAHYEQMLAPQRDQTQTQGRDQGVRDLRRAVPEQPADRRGAQEAARVPRPPERVRVRGRPLLLPDTLVPGRDRPLQGAPQGRPRVHAPRRASTTTSRTRSARCGCRRRPFPTSTSCSRSSRRASSWRRAKKLMAELQNPPSEKPPVKGEAKKEVKGRRSNGAIETAVR